MIKVAGIVLLVAGLATPALAEKPSLPRGEPPRGGPPVQTVPATTPATTPVALTQTQNQQLTTNPAGGSGQGGTVNNNNNVSAGNGGGWGGPGTFPASTATAPSFALASICQEAISGGVSVFWAGASGGKVYTLDFCKMTMQADYWRKNGREDMAKAAECKFAEARALYKETGTPCREDGGVVPPVQSRSAGYIGPNGFTPWPAGYTPSN